MIKVAIIGANGYAGEELCGLLQSHPDVEIVCAASRQHAGKRVGDVIPRLAGKSALASLVISDSNFDAIKDCGAEFFFFGFASRTRGGIRRAASRSRQTGRRSQRRFPAAGRGYFRGVLRRSPRGSGPPRRGGLRHSGTPSGRDQESAARRIGWLLPDQHHPASGSAFEKRTHLERRHRGVLRQRRQRRGTEGGCHASLR